MLKSGAHCEIMNDSGHKATHSIDGGKTGENAYDNAVTILRAAGTREQLDIALSELEKPSSDPELISKEMLIQTGMAKKKSPDTQAIWDHKRFLALAAKFDAALN